MSVVKKLSVVKAYEIANVLEDVPDQYTMTKDPLSLIKAFAANDISPTKADDFIIGHMPSMTQDPIAGEYFHTLFDTHPDLSHHSSAHTMVLQGEGTQELHYHPRANDVQETSERYVLVYPLWNAEKKEGGVTFDWFDTKDTKIVQNEGEKFRHVVATPISPMATVRLEPGHIALLKFPAGVHRFAGHGFALSVHPLDIDHGNSGLGSFLGNVAGYNRKESGIPKRHRTITPTTYKGKGPNPGTSLQSLFTAHSLIVRDFLHNREPGSFSGQEFRNFVSKLRQVRPNGHVVSETPEDGTMGPPAMVRNAQGIELNR